MANLRYLVLSKNRLTGSIPPQLGSLENLAWLYLWGNQLSGEIPPELGNLKNLENLSLSYNNLVGTVPLELENITLLESLYLSENSFSGCIPELWRDVEDNDLEDANIAICSDWEALAALYEAAGGDDWVDNDNWLSDAPLSTWFGVTTDEDGRVIALELAENELRGDDSGGVGAPHAAGAAGTEPQPVARRHSARAGQPLAIGVALAPRQ